jgi:hypothetical protein
MTWIDRRRFVTGSAATAVMLPSLRTFAEVAPSRSVKIGFLPGPKGAVVPQNFLGLSYETQQLSDPSFFSPENAGLITQFRALSGNAVLRLGGNTSDVGWWKPTPDSKMPPLPANVVLRTPPGEKSPMDLAYSVTPEAVRNLRGFLDAVGWTCLYGINLGTNTPELAAEQAAFVAKTLGDKLEYFQIGNEPDGFWSRFRAEATWTVETYMDDWLAAVNAIRARVPEAKFAVPDVAGKTGWLAPIADRLTAMADPPKVAAVTHHYYFTGPPSNPKANIHDLLLPDERVAHDAELAKAAGTKLKTAWRLTEGNSCYRGGRPGMSDVFAASLWAADYLLKLASLGYSGVNLHGGDGQMVANSLGGRLPGDDLVKDDPAGHPHPYYTPIAHIGSKYVAEPVFHGMKFAGAFAGAEMMPLEFDPGTVNATAYAGKMPDGTSLIAIINKDAANDLSLNLRVPGKVHMEWLLGAPSLDSAEVSLAKPAKQSLVVKRGSAVLLRCRPR